MKASDDYLTGVSRNQQMAPEIAPLPRAGRPKAPDFVEEITLRRIFAQLWRGWWLIGLTALVFVGWSVWSMKGQQPVYKATMVVSPTSESEGGGRFAQLASLARIGGFDVPTKEAVSPYILFLELMTSTRLAERLEARYGILRLYYDTRWDEETQAWKPPTGVADTIIMGIRRFFGLPPYLEPSPERFAQNMGGALGVAPVKDTGLRRIDLSHTDPEVAVRVLDLLYREADALLREEAVQRSNAQIAYLEAKLREVTTTGYRTVLIDLLADEEQRLMLTGTDQPFAARQLETPRWLSQPIAPQPLRTIALSGVLGLLVGAFLVFVKDVVRPRRGRTAAKG